MALMVRPLARSGIVVVALTALLLGPLPLTAHAGSVSALHRLMQLKLDADLRITGFKLDRSDARVGDMVRATVTISNAGPAAARSATLTLWTTVDDAGADAYQLAVARLGALPAGSSITHVSMFQVPAFSRTGLYKVFATVGASSREFDQGNNTRTTTLRINGAAIAGGVPTVPGAPSDLNGPPASTPTLVVTVERQPVSPSPSGSGSGASAPAPETTPGDTASAVPSTGGSTPGAGTGSEPTDGGGPSAVAPAPGPVAAAPSSDSVQQDAAPPVCHYYASPKGTGAGTTPESPFKIQNFWSVASPGKTLCLLDGTYQGPDSMIDAGVDAPGLSGTSTAPIVIRALNDGAVTIDGQYARVPIRLESNSWLLIEGINAKHGDWGVAIVRNSSNNVFRRVVLWDAAITKNVAVVLHDGGSNNLWEDAAFFGTARFIFNQYRGSNTTCRRCWARFEGSISNSGPKRAFQMAYGGSPNLNFTCENCLATWSPISMPQEYYATDGNGNVTSFYLTNYEIVHRVGPFGTEGNPGECLGSKVMGSLVYIRPNDWLSGPSSPASMMHLKYADCQELYHTMVVVHPNYPGRSSIAGFELGTGATTKGNKAQSITSVHSFTDLIRSEWEVQNHSTGSTPGAVASPWTASSSGANLCYRFHGGSRTNIPLWPWPMNDRIKEATASAGAYSGPCPNCVGGRAARVATDVTADVEALLGAIPGTCRTK